MKINPFLKFTLPTLLLFLISIPLVNAENNSAKFKKFEAQFFKENDVKGAKKIIYTADFKAVGLNGAKPNLLAYKNKTILLNFWATWCVPCVAEMPDLEKLHKTFQFDNFVVVAVAVGDSTKKAGKFIKKLKLNFPVYVDSNRKIAQQFAAHSIPISYLIAPNGKIKAKIIGPRNWSDKNWIDYFEKTLK